MRFLPPLHACIHTNPQKDSARGEIEQSLTTWCELILNTNFEDPMIRRRVIQLMVTVSTTALDKKADLMLKILEHVCRT